MIAYTGPTPCYYAYVPAAIALRFGPPGGIAAQVAPAHARRHVDAPLTMLSRLSAHAGTAGNGHVHHLTLTEPGDLAATAPGVPRTETR